VGGVGNLVPLYVQTTMATAKFILYIFVNVHFPFRHLDTQWHILAGSSNILLRCPI